MITEPAALLRLLACASPAFPTGGFAYSQGLEWAVEEGWVANAATLQAWLSDVAQNGAARTDAILLRHAYRAAGDAHALARIEERANAANFSAERQAETLAQGTAFIASAAPWCEPFPGELGTAPYPTAFGSFCARQGISEDAACLAYLANWASTMISAAIRLSVLGQAGGLRVQRALEPILAAAAQESKTATLDDLGATCFLADIAAMRHETQFTRLFRS